jgi:hypothetical protein
MFYDGPTQQDYVNIQALNREFVRQLREQPDRFGLDKLQADRLKALGRQQLERLASTPFLLLSLQENNEVAWSAVCNADPNTDLFENGGAVDPGLSNLLATTAGFLWQLAQQNPHTVRLICGASPGWCEMITAMTYFELVTSIRCRTDLPVIRQAPNTDIWGKLLVEGVRAERPVRSAAHIAALQMLLTACSGPGATSWPVAACKTKPQHLRVADEPRKT